ncbi:MAG: hypothetical protein V3R81_07820, partial [Gammaproteobacteria bacterium]
MQKIYGNSLNLLKNLTLTASGLTPSQAHRATGFDRSGGGLVSIAGAYTGQDDRTLDIDVHETILGTDSLVSEVVFSGVGSGTMTDAAAVPATPAQSLTVTLKNLGVPTFTAALPIGPTSLTAKVAGAPGNNISISVDDSLITRVATDFSIPDEGASKGSNGFIGEEWNFGAVPLADDGQIPADAPRLQIGDQPTIYRQYSEFSDGARVYRFTPEIKQDIRGGMQVYDVSGAYTVTVTDGVTPEPYPGVVTLFDFLDQLDTSLLVTVDDVATDDR